MQGRRRRCGAHPGVLDDEKGEAEEVPASGKKRWPG
jgi:hypothetical protein